MRIALSPQESPQPPDDDELARTLSLTVPVEEAWALEATRMMVEHMDGKSTRNEPVQISGSPKPPPPANPPRFERKDATSARAVR